MAMGQRLGVRDQGQILMGISGGGLGAGSGHRGAVGNRAMLAGLVS